MKLFFVLFIVALARSALSERVEFETCQDVETDCDVQDVKISPCPEATSGNRCKVKRGKTVNISFDFKPKFDAADNLENDVYWVSPDGDLPWAGLERNACSHTTCPLKKDEVNSFSYDIQTDKYAPPRNYDVKWILQNGDNKKCCFIVKIHIKK